MAKMKLPEKALVELPGQAPTTVALYNNPTEVDISDDLQYIYNRYVQGGVLKDFFTPSHMVEDVWRGDIDRKDDGTGFHLHVRDRCNQDLRIRLCELAGINGSASCDLINNGFNAIADQQARKLRRLSVTKYTPEAAKAARQLEHMLSDASARDAVLASSSVAKNPPIVLLLESPHNAEYLYCDAEFYPLVPANGAAGEAIEKGIGNLFSQIGEGLGDDDIIAALHFPAPLIICNPVQFQSSLHFLLRGPLQAKTRDHIWRRLWTMRDAQGFPVVRNFVERVTSYNPQLILNACTAGVCRFVQNATNKVRLGKHVPCYMLFHPARNWPKQYGLLAQEQ